MNTTNTPQADILQSQTNADATPPNNNNSSELITRDELPNTPFTIVTTEKGSFLAMGRIRLSEDMTSKELVHEYIKNNMWTIVTHIIGGMITLNNEFNINKLQ